MGWTRRRRGQPGILLGILQKLPHARNECAELFNRPTHLYRFFDKDGRLFYIGVSLSAVIRLAQHVQGSHWVHHACQVIWETLPNRYAALKAEKDAIQAERPPLTSPIIT
jgi:excinuclease UvrABC nuclease subunit